MINVQVVDGAAVSVDVTRLPIDPIEGGQLIALPCNHLVRARVPGALIYLSLSV